MASDDPDFEAKAADVIGLYLALRRSTRSCSAWMRRRRFRRWTVSIRVLPLSPGRLERHGFEYRRNGTLSLYAGAGCEVRKRCKARLPSATPARSSSASSNRSSLACKPHQEIHIILRQSVGTQRPTRSKTSSTPKQPREASLHTYLFFLAQSSWRSGFARLEREVIARGIFTSGPRSLAQTPALHPCLFENSPPLQMEVLRRSKRILPC